MRRHFVVIVGRWKFENWHLYRRTQHVAAKKASVRWVSWDRVF